MLYLKVNYDNKQPTKLHYPGMIYAGVGFYDGLVLYVTGLLGNYADKTGAS